MAKEQKRRLKRKPVFGHGVWLDDDLKVVERLGRNRKVDLYLCESISMKHRVACKVLRPEHRTDPDLMDDLKAEGEIVVEMDHPNVVEGYDLIMDYNPRIIMEYLPGLTVSDAFLSGNYEAFDLSDMVSVAEQLADAIEYVHEQGYLHLDVKTSNAMYEDGYVTLFDFSVARTFSPGEKLVTTAGTRNYKSPEQVDKSPLGYYTDVYGLGATFYRLLTEGQLPYPLIEEIDMGSGEKERILDYSKRPMSPTDITPWVPAVLSDVALAAIDTDPGKRMQTPREFKAALLHAAEKAAIPMA